MRRAALVALALTLAACNRSDLPPRAVATEDVAPSPSPLATASDPEADDAAKVALALDAEGLRFVAADTASTSMLAFGSPRGQVEQAVQRAVGDTPARFTGEECPAGPTGFTAFGELQLAFQDDRWIGWALGGAFAATTMDGIGIGTTRAEAERTREVTMVSDSTLGDEFVLGSADQETAIGGIFGGPGPQERIEYLWAGVACNFR